jgi:hypothetical protein
MSYTKKGTHSKTTEFFTDSNFLKVEILKIVEVITVRRHL